MQLSDTIKQYPIKDALRACGVNWTSEADRGGRTRLLGNQGLFVDNNNNTWHSPDRPTKGGSIIDWVIMERGCEWTDALKYLVKVLNIPSDGSDYVRVAKKAKPVRPSLTLDISGVDAQCPEFSTYEGIEAATIADEGQARQDSTELNRAYMTHVMQDAGEGAPNKRSLLSPITEAIWPAWTGEPDKASMVTKWGAPVTICNRPIQEGFTRGPFMPTAPSKAPFVSANWQHLTSDLNTVARQAAGDPVGVGVLCGSPGDNGVLCVVDVDKGLPEVLEAFPELLQTFHCSNRAMYLQGEYQSAKFFFIVNDLPEWKKVRANHARENGYEWEDKSGVASLKDYHEWRLDEDGNPPKGEPANVEIEFFTSMSKQVVICGNHEGKSLGRGDSKRANHFEVAPDDIGEPVTEHYSPPSTYMVSKGVGVCECSLLFLDEIYTYFSGGSVGLIEALGFADQIIRSKP